MTKATKLLSRGWLFWRSAWASSLEYWRVFGWRAWFQFVGNAAPAVIRAFLFPERGPEIARVFGSKLRQCFRCPMFNRDLMTCGTPGEVFNDGSGPQTNGCWCNMVIKARIKGSTCWARDNGLGFGWKEE